MNGILIVNKPKDLTSRDVVNHVCEIFDTKKVGHAGTLDPLATGVLVLAINDATKVLELLQADDKEYVAEVQLGLKTDTGDVTGNALKIIDKVELEESVLNDAVLSFKKKYNQVVPIYSAVKVNGKKLYEYAREGRDVRLPSRLVNIKEIELLGYHPERQSYSFKTLVSKGTYIRSLIEDIGDYISVPSSMKNLIRTKSGVFTIKDAICMEDISINNELFKIEDVLNFKKIYLDESDTKKVSNGVFLELDESDDKVMLFNTDKKLMAIYRKEKDYYRPFKMFLGDI